jgi:hypothetical protein
VIPNLISCCAEPLVPFPCKTNPLRVSKEPGSFELSGEGLEDWHQGMVREKEEFLAMEDRGIVRPLVVSLLGPARHQINEVRTFQDRERVIEKLIVVKKRDVVFFLIYLNDVKCGFYIETYLGHYAAHSFVKFGIESIERSNMKV